MRIDLHVHSTASDGSLSPTALVGAAATGGLDVVALTDHDTASGVKEAVAAGVGTVHVIPALEISTTLESAEQHILGYFVDLAHPRLVEYERVALSARRDRMQGMLRRLEDIGVNVGLEEVFAAAGSETSPVGRPHLARALVERGYAQSFADAFDRYIGDRGPAYLPTRLLDPEQAIELIHDAGGLAVWAHPRAANVQRDLDRFVRWGLDGLECFRPRCAPEESVALEANARTHGLLVTGGSDWHGTWHGRLGEFSVSLDEVGAFLERGGI